MKKGFTTIELLIVIVVLVVLVGIALPRFRRIQEEAYMAKAAGQLRSLAAAVESYHIYNTSRYPSPSTAVTTEWESDITSASPRIISSALSDPFQSSQEYGYATSAATSPDYYVIFSVGPDGTADITGINASGAIQGGPDDDIYISNGTSASGGF